MSGPSGFDENALRELERIVGRDALKEVLDLYLANAGRRIDAVRAGLRARDSEATATALHEIKSSAGQLGATAVRRLAEELEHLVRASAMDAARARRGELEVALAEAHEWMRQARRQWGRP